MPSIPPQTLTIGRLARAASVGVETIRYYQQRGLLPVPEPTGAFRWYSVELIGRIHFIRRAQELGFSLLEVTELLRLDDGTDRTSIRRIASGRLDQIEKKLKDLKRMQAALKHLIDECVHTDTALPCPIIATLSSLPGSGRAYDRGESRGAKQNDPGDCHLGSD